MNGRSAEVVVVGGGVVGLAAAAALAERGADVRCLERGEPGSGQSAGYTRVFRHAHDRLDLVELVHGARAGWDVWSEQAGAELVGPEGVLYAGPDGEDVASFFAAAGVEHRWVDADEQRLLLPFLSPPTERALLDVRGGAIRVRATIAALVARLGDRLVREEVLTLQPDGQGMLLATPEGVWRADRVLLCAGVGTPALAAPLGIGLPLEVRLHVRATFVVRPEHRRRPPACWLDRTGLHGATVYSGPVRELDGFAVGLATEDGGADVDVVRAVARTRAYVERALPGLGPEPLALRPCWLTILPWHPDSFAVWKAGPVLAFAGSNLFKLAPALGRLLAEAVATDEIPPALRPPS